MDFQSSVKITGHLSIKKYNSNNRLIEHVEIPNLIVNSGKQYIASRMVNGSSNVMSHMAIGNGSTVSMLSNVSLVDETARVALDSTSTENSVVKYIAMFPQSVGTGTISEAGIFNALTAGTMLARTTFPAITKNETEEIVIEWTVSVG